jgi:dihydrofolate reductase
VTDRGRLRVYIACSLDGFIAGVDDDLSWLPGSDGQGSVSESRDEGALGFEDFMAEVGALLMGRRTYDVVCGFGGDWPYGERPVLVATHRPLEPKTPMVRPVEGDIAHLAQLALEAAGGEDVYLDGGALVREALDADLVDELVVTIAPVVLGKGQPLFAGVSRRQTLDIVGHHRFDGGMVQLHLRPRR